MITTLPSAEIDIMQRLVASDRMSKRERVEATLSNQPGDRAALHEQLSFHRAMVETVGEIWNLGGDLR
jgi:hypothetical protein